eukprot:scaffold98770_cov60-Cyclotella_meneghiniana.AAC.2
MHIELIKNWLQIRNTSKIKRTYLIFIDLPNEPNYRHMLPPSRDGRRGGTASFFYYKLPLQTSTPAACNTLLVVTAAVLVEVGAAIRGAARLVSATAAARHGCCRNFGARGLFGNGREL